MARTNKDQRGIPQHCGVCGSAGHKRTFHARAAGKRCTLCKEWKSPESFFLIKRGEVGHLSPVCRPCNVIKCRADYTSSPRGRILRLWHSAKSRSAKANRVFDVTVDELVAMFERQEGRCHYTGRPMTFARGPDAVSLERLNPALGYVPGNVVLAQWRINNAKGDMTVAEFEEMCRDVQRLSRPLLLVEAPGCRADEARTVNRVMAA